MIKKKFDYYKAIYVVTVASLLFTASGLRADEHQPVSKSISENTKEFLSDPARTGSLLGSILIGAAVPTPLSPLLGSLAGFLIGKRSAYSNKNSNTVQRQDFVSRSLIPEDGNAVVSLTGLTGNPQQASEEPLMFAATEETWTGNQSEQNEPIVIVENTPSSLAIKPLSEKIGTGNQFEPNEQLISVGTTPMGSAIKSLYGETETGNWSEQSEPRLLMGSTPTGLSNKPWYGNTENADQFEQTANLGVASKRGARSYLQQQLASACSNVQLTQPLSLGCYYHSQ